MNEAASPDLRVSGVVDGLCASLEAAKVETAPFEHLFVQEVFPSDVYGSLQASLPPTDSYISMSARRTTNINAQLYRKRINLTSPEILRIPEAERTFWEIVRDSLCDPRFIDAVLKSFSPGLLRRYGTTEITSRVRVELFRDSDGYEIGPHTDAPHKILTLIFYLPPNTARPDLGTAVYAPKDASMTDERSFQHPFELFDEIERAPFFPNSVFGFMKSERSFHGRPPIEGGVERNMINCTFQHAGRYVA